MIILQIDTKQPYRKVNNSEGLGINKRKRALSSLNKNISNNDT